MIALSVALIHVLIWGGLLTAAGVSLLLYGQKLNRKPAPKPGWQAAKGKVLSIEVARVPKPGSGMSGFAPVMGYGYEANGRQYQGGETVTGPHLATDSVSANKLAERYPVGTAVTVHYDPRDPRQAAVEVDPRRGTFYLTAGWALIGLALLVACSILGFGVLMETLVSSSTAF